jgi:hypothetical protein
LIALALSIAGVISDERKWPALVVMALIGVPLLLGLLGSLVNL